MKLLLKLTMIFVPLVVVLVLLWGLYIGVISGLVNIPGLSGALKTTGKPVSPEARARGAAVREKIAEDVGNGSAFLVQLTDQQLTDLLTSQINPQGQIRDASVDTKTGEIAFSGHLNGVATAVSFSTVT